MQTYFGTIKRENQYVFLWFLLIIEERGLRRSELVNWYLGIMEENIEDEQDLAETKLLVDMVIDRLIKHVSTWL